MSLPDPTPDAWRAVGYLQARDRLWQMELYRRAASGRLSELLGEATVAIDQRFLTLGLRLAAEREWERTPPDVRTAFENYAAGVNAAMAVARGSCRSSTSCSASRRSRGRRSIRWRSASCSPGGSARTTGPSCCGTRSLREMGPRALELFPRSPEWAPVILERAERGERASRCERCRGASYPPGLEWLSPDAHAMSNSWVIHGSRTASGRPILANDPHLAIEMPSVWWEVHVVSGTLNVAGVTIPGIPFVVIGHNARIGWGLTNVGSDVQDFFVEQLDASRQRYRVGDDWVPLADPAPRDSRQRAQ